MIHFRVDLSDSDGAARLLAEASSRFGRITGVVHAVGESHDGLVRDRSVADLRAAWSAKVGGARALYSAARDFPFEWMVLFSSTAGALGNGGQSAYALANATLDALSQSWSITSQGPRVHSLVWPLWRDGGMRAPEERVRWQADQLGLYPLETLEGLAILDGLQAISPGAIVVLKGDPEKLCAPRRDRATASAMHAIPEASDGNLPPALIDLLRELAAGVLKLDPVLLDPEIDSAEYGFDSVTFTSLANEVGRALALEVTPAMFFEHRTLAEFGDYLWQEFREVVARRFQVQTVAVSTPLAAPAIASPPEAVGGTNRVSEQLPRSVGEREPIAIIGMSGRFPGSTDLEAFWTNLEAGCDLIGKPSADRWMGVDGEAMPWGGFIDDIDKFDARFFDISPREAELMDPQQRIFLETVWHAIEDAGYAKSELSGTKTGLFVGVAANDYANVLAASSVEVEAYSATGNAHSVLANRVSYIFDLNGPSEAIDTACSSSLVAIHRAIESMESGSSEMAIVGGVNALLSSAGFTAFTRAGMLSPDGRCKSFDARADGYVRGEGVGALLLKPLARAQRDGDQIYATIIGSAENHGGHVQSLTVPNPNAQARLLQDAWTRAGIDPATIGYIESHGTGTALGDPIEINGLKKAFASVPLSEVDPRCAVGAVKTNIGHLETSAGIAGVLKTLLALRHRCIPGTVHLQEINPYIQTSGTALYFPTQAEPWPVKRDAQGREIPRRAGVSSFGFGGSNAHVVLEEYGSPAVASGQAIESEEATLIVLSARSQDQLVEAVRRLAEYLTRPDAPALRDIAEGLQRGREEMNMRLALVVRDRTELVKKLTMWQTGESVGDCWTGDTQENPAAVRVLRSLHGDPASLAPWWAARDWATLGQLWTAGVKLHWSTAYADHPPRRVRLPLYPFSRDRHWVPGATAPAGKALRVRVVEAEFSIKEPILGDHLVQERAVLPGAAIVAVMTQAWQQAAGVKDVELRRVMWLRPITPDERGIAAFTVRVGSSLDGGGDIAVEDTDGSVLATATAARPSSKPIEVIAWAEVKARCGKTTDVTELYEAFAARGLSYGAGYRVIHEIGFNDHEAWSKLELPDLWRAQTSTGAGAHPALIDGALQTLAVLGSDSILEVPFALGMVNATDLPPVCYVHARLKSQETDQRTFSLRITNEAGVVLGRLDDYALRELRAAGPEYLVPTWVPSLQRDINPIKGDCLLFDESPALAEELRLTGLEVTRVVAGSTYRESGDVVWLRRDEPGDYERLLQRRNVGAVVHRWSTREVDRTEVLACGLHSVHALTQAWVQRQPDAKQPLLFIHPPGLPGYEAVAAYVKSARYEYPALNWTTLATDDVSARLCSELNEAREEVRWVERKREVKDLVQWKPVNLRSAGAIRREGVYVITGGGGGLGQIFAEFLVTHYSARVVLAGRSQGTIALQKRLAAWGDKATYVMADISTTIGATAVIAEAKARFGGVNGVLHAAGVLRDGLLRQKTRADFDEVLAPKMEAVEALDAATMDEPLDWILLCSSSVGMLGNAGQSDYAFANAYLDSFARWREEERSGGRRSGRTFSINWPLWSDGGMQAKSGIDVLGMRPLATAEGLKIFETVLHGDQPQVWGFAGKATDLLRRLQSAPSAMPAGSTLPRSSKPKGREAMVIELTQWFAELSKVAAGKIRPTESLEQYGLDSILAVEFSQRIGKVYGEVSQAVVFEHSSIEALCAYLENRVPASPVDVEQPLAAVPATPSVMVLPLEARSRRQLMLAPIDYVFVAPQRLAMQILYYFERPLDADLLRRGLIRTAEAFFPINSRLQRRGKNEYAICECSDDPDYMEVQEEGDVLVPREDDPMLLERFRVSFDPTKHGEKLAKFRLHQLQHGSLLAVNVSHAIADGYSFYYFMSAWSAACRGEPFLIPDHSRSKLRKLVRETVRREGASWRVPELATVGPRFDPMARRVETQTFNGAALLEEARRTAGPMEHSKLTENSVVTAHLWKLYASELTDVVGELTLACPVNFRRHDGPFSHSFFGNAMAPAVLRLERNQVMASSIPSLASAITDAVRACDERELVRYNGAVEQLRLTRGLAAVRRALLADPATALVVTNVARFNLPPMDFGTGPATEDINLCHYAGTAVIVPGEGNTLKVRIGYPTSTAGAAAIA